jgi:hypothetical protein
VFKLRGMSVETGSAQVLDSKTFEIMTWEHTNLLQKTQSAAV